MSDPRVYRFDTLDRTGIFLGLGLAQLAILAVGAVAGTLALSAGVPLGVAATPIVGAGAVAFGRVGGDRLVEWIPVAAAWLLHRRRRSWFAPLHPLTATERGQRRQPALPPWLHGIELLEAPDSWATHRNAGIVHDTTTHTMAALIRVHTHGFALATRDDQIAMLAGWGDVLAAFAAEHEAVARLSWSDTATPTGVADHHAWLATTQRPPSAAGDAYAELLATAAAHTISHDILLTVIVSRDRVGRGSEPADRRLAATLHAAVDTLTRAVTAAGWSATPPLPPGELAAVLRARLDPAHRAIATGATRGGLSQRLGAAVANAGPQAVATTWDTLQVDGSWHRTYWIAEWPRLHQHPDWMTPLLAAPITTATRTVTVIFEPVAPAESRRRVRRDAIRLETDAATREERGRRVDGGHRRLQSAVAEREAELVAGYAEVAYAGIVTVTAADRDHLDGACAETEHLAREHGLELRALHGRHDTGFATALPLGLGVARTWAT